MGFKGLIGNQKSIKSHQAQLAVEGSMKTIGMSHWNNILVKSAQNGSLSLNRLNGLKKVQLKSSELKESSRISLTNRKQVKLYGKQLSMFKMWFV